MTAIEIIAIGGSLATTIGLFVASWQLVVAAKQRKDSARRSAVKEAVVIARMFQERLVHEMAFVVNVYKELGLHELISIVPTDQSLKFTQEEAKERFGADSIEKHHDMVHKVSQSILDNVAMKSVAFKIETRSLAHSSEDEARFQTEMVERNKVADFYNSLTELANTLEWVGMLINSGAADEEVIYQSLHQVFLRYVHLNYFGFARFNCEASACDHYYINVIELYNNWVQKREQQRCEDEKRQAKKSDAHRKMDKKIEAARKKTIHRVPHI